MSTTEKFEWMIEQRIITEDEYHLVTDINGETDETAEEVLYARTGEREFPEMCEDCGGAVDEDCFCEEDEEE